MCIPTSVLPVKSTPSTLRWPTSRSAWRPGTCTRLNTPGGKPAASMHSAMISGHAGRVARRLEHDGVAGRQRRHDVAVRQMRREVEGPDDGHDPARQVADATDHAFRRHVLDEAHAVLQRDRHLAGDRLGLRARLPEHLAHLAADALRQSLGVLRDRLGVARQVRGALFEGHAAPARERATRGADRLVDRVGPPRELADHVVGVAGVLAADDALRILGDPKRAVDVVASHFEGVPGEIAHGSRARGPRAESQPFRTRSLIGPPSLVHPRCCRVVSGYRDSMLRVPPHGQPRSLAARQPL